MINFRAFTKEDLKHWIISEDDFPCTKIAVIKINGKNSTVLDNGFTVSIFFNCVNGAVGDAFTMYHEDISKLKSEMSYSELERICNRF